MMCNFKNCFFEIFKITANIVYNLKMSLYKITPNELSIFIHKNFIEINKTSKYYIQKDNKIINDIPLITLTDDNELQKITTNYFIPYLLLFYNNKTINLELHDDQYTYYIVGNKINKDLIKFYLENKYNIKMDDKEKYRIELMNNDFKTVLLTDESVIYFEKDTYKII